MPTVVVIGHRRRSATTSKTSEKAAKAKVSKANKTAMDALGGSLLRSSSSSRSAARGITYNIVSRSPTVKIDISTNFRREK